MMWAETGAKQVGILGAEEKRAFTILISISNDGTVLPFQAIYFGKTKDSCPSPSSPCYSETQAAGFHFNLSRTKTYWSNHQTMHEFVDNVLAPYFDNAKAAAGQPPAQKMLWQIDVWSVHQYHCVKCLMAECKRSASDATQGR
jgi:hypothetical protein